MENLSLFQSHLEIGVEVTAFITDKTFGDMNPDADPKRFVEQFNAVRQHAQIAEDTLIVGPHLGRGAKVILLASPSAISNFAESPYGVSVPNEECDALIMELGDRPFGFFAPVADNPLLLLHGKNAEEKEYLAFVYCNLHTLVGGVIKSTVKAMDALGCVPRTIEGQMLPGIGHCCFGVSEKDVARICHANMQSSFLLKKHGATEFGTCSKGPCKDLTSVNLPLGICSLADKAGILSAGGRHFFCTSCKHKRFFSKVRGDKEMNGAFVFVQPKFQRSAHANRQTGLPADRRRLLFAR